MLDTGVVDELKYKRHPRPKYIINDKYKVCLILTN